MRPTIRPILLAALAIIWVLTLAFGFGRLWSYESTPGRAATTHSVWPAQSTLARDASAVTVVMAVHPKCPCSQASMAELARVAARVRNVRIYVLAVVPAEASEQHWTHTSLIRRAGEIPGAQVIADRGGIEAARFGAQTSGYACLYAKDGRLLFCGGITGSRGHEGDNPGEDALIAAANGEVPDLRQSPVFGCALSSQIAQASQTPASQAGNGGWK